VRLKGTVLTSVVVAALAAALGAAPVYADGKPDAGKPGGIGYGLLAADVAAGRTAPPTSPEVSLASSTVQSRILDYVRANGTRYTFGSYADALSGKVVLETDAPSEVVSALVGTFGELVEVRKQTISDQFHRRDDVAPFWGGAGVTPTSGVPHCSDGYVVQNAVGTRFMVTAGHCFSNGQTARTETAPGVVVGGASGNGLGTGRDMVILGGQSYGSSIYTGGVTSTTGAHIASAADPIVGFANYCHSGRTTGTNCGHTVNSVTATVCTQTGCKSPVIAYTGGTLPQGGDSGGSFFVDSVSAPDKHIRGHHIAGGGGTSYAELYSRVVAWFGVTIVI
jgi:hypothetical protein